MQRSQFREIFPSPILQQIKFTLQQCQQNCKSQKELNYYLMKSGIVLQLSDSYVDSSVKENPIKMYSRDMYWPISKLIPKDVFIKIRNNYVHSDFGWFTSDIITQVFPFYSFYEDFVKYLSDILLKCAFHINKCKRYLIIYLLKYFQKNYQLIQKQILCIFEKKVYPADFQNYYLNVTIRLEKQKQNVYQRSYPRFTDVIAQIGGFTQSFLAIGFIICNNFSQLQLNQQIVNSIFNYDEAIIDQQKQQQQIDANKQQRHMQLQNQKKGQNIDFLMLYVKKSKKMFHLLYRKLNKKIKIVKLSKIVNRYNSKIIYIEIRIKQIIKYSHRIKHMVEKQQKYELLIIKTKLISIRIA
ncbi:hypothetical protein ABPG72_018037 [Tetrahymena utriculariae]